MLTSWRSMSALIRVICRLSSSPAAGETEELPTVMVLGKPYLVSYWRRTAQRTVGLGPEDEIQRWSLSLHQSHLRLWRTSIFALYTK